MIGIEMLERLCECAVSFSSNTQNRQVPSWREEKGSLIFAKQTATCKSFLRLIPKSTHYAASGGRRVWDISSAASLSRNIVESYCTFFYVAIDEVTDEENLFRERLWEYHAAFERHEMFRIGLPHSTHLSQMKGILEEEKKQLEGTVHFQKLSSAYQARLLEGKQFRVLDNVAVCQRARISENYYRADFKFCSAYTHTSPFAISQGAVFRAGTPETEQVFDRIVQSTIGWMALAVRDFARLFPDQEPCLAQDVKECIELWEKIFKWEKQPDFQVLAEQAARTLPPHP